MTIKLNEKANHILVFIIAHGAILLLFIFFKREVVHAFGEGLNV